MDPIYDAMTDDRSNRLLALLASATAATALVSLISTWVHMAAGDRRCARRPMATGWMATPLRPVSAGVQAPLEIHPADAASEVAEIIERAADDGSSRERALDRAARHLFDEYGWRCSAARSFVLHVANE